MASVRTAPLPGDGVAPPDIVVSDVTSLGTLARIVRDPLTSIPPETRTHRMVLARTFGQTKAYVCDPALIHEAIVRQADHLGKSDEMKRVLGSALGEGLLTADGTAWRWQRQAIAPAFQHDRLTGLLAPMIAAAEATRDRLLAGPRDHIVDLGHEMMLTTFQIIVDTMLSGPDGMDAAAVESGLTDFLKATPWMFVMAMLGAPRWAPFPGKRRATAATRVMRTLVGSRIAARRAAPAKADDLLGMLLAAKDPETGRAMTDEEIADNILTFIAAGHETTALALGWTFALLAAHPDCAARLVADIERVTGGGPLLPGHVAELGYARQVFNEAMRLYPPAPLIARAVHRDMEVAGVALPARSVIFVPIHSIHRHEALWPRPDRFDPDRFAPEASRSRHRFAFMPFGAGPRTCVGSAFAAMEAVAILAVLIRAVRFDLVDPHLPRPQMQVTLRPLRPLRMRAAPR